MPRTPAACTQATIARALRAVRDCGAPMRVKLEPNGVITFEPMVAGEASTGPDLVDPPSTPEVEPKRKLVL